MANVFKLALLKSEAAGAWGRGMAEYERGEFTARELGALRARMTRTENAWVSARFAQSMLSHNNGTMA